jgi:hypothetical protein
MCAGALLFGCAEGGGGGDAGGGEFDAGPERDGGRRPDAGDPGVCLPGQHNCGGGCIDDLPNEIGNGCRLGCGEPCPTPPDGEAACSVEGTCTIACVPPFREQDGECVCTPSTCVSLSYQCGAPDDGCGTPLNCGDCDGAGVCTDGRCACPEDTREPNESFLSAPMIASLGDSPDRGEMFATFNLHDDTDVDWFTVRVSDDCCDGNPHIRVDLDARATGNDYELHAYFMCDSGGDASDCTRADPCSGAASGTSPERIELDTECSGTDETGMLYIEIVSNSWGGSCEPYDLSVFVN